MLYDIFLNWMIIRMIQGFLCEMINVASANENAAIWCQVLVFNYGFNCGLASCLSLWLLIEQTILAFGMASSTCTQQRLGNFALLRSDLSNQY